MKHTETPYKLLTARTLINIKGVNGEQICQIPLKDKERAEFIVAACNSRDDLLAACKKTEWVAMDSLAKWRCPSCMNSKENGHRHDCKTGQAIAKAEG